MTLTTWKPWNIDRHGTLELRPSSRDPDTGTVVVECDVFDDWHGLIHDHRGSQLFTINGDEFFTEGEYPECRPALMNDVQHNLFRYIDARQQTMFILQTLHPVKVREVWPRAGFPDAGVPGTLGKYRQLANVTLSIGPLRKQTDYNQLFPQLLKLRTLCSWLTVWLQPTERIQLNEIDAGPHRHPWTQILESHQIGAVFVSGGKAPLHPDHVRFLRDQAATAGVPFVFTSWGDWVPEDVHLPGFNWTEVNGDPKSFLQEIDVETGLVCIRVGREHSGCELDGRHHLWNSETAT